MPPLFWSNLIHLGATWVGVALLLALMHLQERTTSRHVAHHLGWRGVLVTGWLGVPVHELSHLLAAIIFRHRIVAWRLFDPDPVTGTLGYVRHAYSRRNVWQVAGGFFIAVAPVVGGGLALAALLWWMAPASTWQRLPALQAASTSPLLVLLTIKSIAAAVWHGRTLWFPLQIYLALCVASHMAPSGADLKGGAWGAALMLVLGAALAAVAAHLGRPLTQGSVLLALLLMLLLLAAVFQGGYAAAARALSRMGRRNTTTGSCRAR